MSAGGNVALTALTADRETGESDAFRLYVTTGDGGLVGIGSAVADMTLDITTEASVGRASTIHAATDATVSAVSRPGSVRLSADGDVGGFYAEGEIIAALDGDVSSRTVIGTSAAVHAGGDVLISGVTDIPGVDAATKGGAGGVLSAGGQAAGIDLGAIDARVVVQSGDADGDLTRTRLSAGGNVTVRAEIASTLAAATDQSAKGVVAADESAVDIAAVRAAGIALQPLSIISAGDTVEVTAFSSRDEATATAVTDAGAMDADAHAFADVHEETTVELNFANTAQLIAPHVLLGADSGAQDIFATADAASGGAHATAEADVLIYAAETTRLYLSGQIGTRDLIVDCGTGTGDALEADATADADGLITGDADGELVQHYAHAWFTGDGEVFDRAPGGTLVLAIDETGAVTRADTGIAYSIDPDTGAVVVEDLIAYNWNSSPIAQFDLSGQNTHIDNSLTFTAGIERLEIQNDSSRDLVLSAILADPGGNAVPSQWTVVGLSAAASVGDWAPNYTLDVQSVGDVIVNKEIDVPGSLDVPVVDIAGGGRIFLNQAGSAYLTGATIHSTGIVRLTADDGILWETGARVESAQRIDLVLDAADVDPDPGEGVEFVFSAPGAVVFAAPEIRITTGADDDTLSIGALSESDTPYVRISTGEGDDRLLLGGNGTSGLDGGDLVLESGAGHDSIESTSDWGGLADSLILDMETNPHTSPQMDMPWIGMDTVDLWYVDVEIIDLQMGWGDADGNSVELWHVDDQVETVNIQGSSLAAEAFRVGMGALYAQINLQGGGGIGGDSLEITGKDDSVNRLEAAAFTVNGMDGGIAWSGIDTLSLLLRPTSDLTIAGLPLAATTIDMGSDELNTPQTVTIGEGDLDAFTFAAAAPDNLAAFYNVSLTISAPAHYTLVFDDRLNPESYAAWLAESGFTRSSNENDHLLPEIGFSGFGGCRLLLGDAGGQLTVTGAPAGLSTTVVGGDGADVVSITGLAQGSVLDILGGAGDDALQVPGSDALAATDGVVFFQGGEGTDSIQAGAIDASDPIPSLYLVSPETVPVPHMGEALAAIKGLGMTNGIFYEAENIEITLTDFADTAYLEATATGTQTVSISGAGGDDAFYAGSENALGGLHGRIAIHGGDNGDGTNGDQLFIDTQDSPLDFDTALGAGGFSGLGLEQPLVYSGFETFRILLGAGSDHVSIGNVPGLSYLEVLTGGGDDVLTIDPTSVYAEHFVIAGGDGDDELVIDNRADPDPASIAISGLNIQGVLASGGNLAVGTGFTSVSLLLGDNSNSVDMVNVSIPLEVVGGAGADTFRVRSLQAGQQLALTGNGGNDLLDVGEYASVDGTVTFSGGEGVDEARIYSLSGEVRFEGGAGRDLLYDERTILSGTILFLGGADADGVLIDQRAALSPTTLHFDSGVGPGFEAETGHIYSGTLSGTGIWYLAEDLEARLSDIPDGSAGINTVYIDATSTETTDLSVYGNAGGDLIRIGEESGRPLADIHGDLVLSGSAGENRLFIDDGDDAAGWQDITLTESAFSGMGLAGELSYSGFIGVTITAGQGGDRIFLDNTPASGCLTDVANVGTSDIVYTSPLPAQAGSGAWTVNGLGAIGISVGMDEDPDIAAGGPDIGEDIYLFNDAGRTVSDVWASSGEIEFVETLSDSVSQYRWTSTTGVSEDVEIYCRDSAGMITAARFHVEVSARVSVPDQSAGEGTVELSGTLVSPGFASGETYTAHWQITDSEGNPVAEAGAEVTRNGWTTTATVSGALDLPVGDYSLVLTVTGSQGTALTATGTLAVENQAPVVDLDPVRQVAGLGATLSGTVADPGLGFGEALTYAWTVTDDATGDTVATGSGAALDLDVSACGYGNYTAVLTVTDAHGETAGATQHLLFAATEVDFPPIVDAGQNVSIYCDESVASINQPVNLHGSFEDTAPTTGETYTCKWELYAISPVDGTWFGPMDYIQPDTSLDAAVTIKSTGTWAAKLTVTDSNGTSASDFLTITVAASPYVVTAAAPLVTYENTNTGGPLLASFRTRSPIPETALNDFTGTIDWGDGSSTPAVFTLANNIFQYSGGGVNYYTAYYNVTAEDGHAYTENSYAEPGGAYPVTISMDNWFSGSATLSTTAVVNTHQPVIVETALTPDVAVAGQTTVLSVDFGDGPDWTYDRTLRVLWGDGTEETIAIANDRRTIDAAHTYDTPGQCMVQTTVERRDEAGHVGESSAVSTDYVTVTAEASVNIDTLPATGEEGTPLSLSASVADASGSESCAWTVTRQGAVSATGEGDAFTFTPDDNGEYAVTLRVTDYDGRTRQAAVTVSVTDVAPSLTLSGADTVAEGTAYTLNLAATDPGDDTIGSWTIDWGDGTDPQVVTGNPESVAHVYADGPGNCVISATAMDEDGSHPADNTLTVSVTNAAPTAAIDGLPESAPEGTPISLTATVGDPGVNDTLSYAWTLLCDGEAVATGNESGFTFTPDGGARYQVVLDVSDGTETTRAVSGILAAANIAPTLTLGGDGTVREDASYTLTLAAEDPGADTLVSWTIDWGDGTAAETVAGDAPEAVHVYADPGDYTISATAADEDGSYAAADTVGVTVIGVPDVEIDGLPAESPEGSAILLAAHVTDPGTCITDYSWTITKNGAAYATGDADTLSFTPDDNGTYGVTLAVTDSSGETGTACGTVVVTDVAPTLVVDGAAQVDEGAVYTLGFSATDDPGTDTVTGWTIDWGDGTQAESLAADATGATHTYAEGPATHTVTVTAVDEDGAHDATQHVTVNNVAPVATIDGLPSGTVDEGATVNLTSGVSDPGAADTFAYSWTVTKDGVVYAAGTGEDFSFVPGDGNATWATPIHYEVTLAVSDGTDSGTATGNVSVADVSPIIALSGADTALAGEAFTLSIDVSDPGDDTITQWVIAWGDDTFDTIEGNPATVDHVYAEGYQTCTISVWADDEDGNDYASDNTHTLYVRSPIEGEVTIDGVAAESAAGMPVIMTAVVSGSSATAFCYQWSVQQALSGGGGLGSIGSIGAEGTGESFAFVPESAGDYSVSLMVFDSDGNLVGQASQSFAVTEAETMVTLHGAETVTAGSLHTLYLNARDGDDTTPQYWRIDWGDGSSENIPGLAASAGHQYADAGSYTISATVYYLVGLVLVPVPSENTVPLTVTAQAPAVSIGDLPAFGYEGTPLSMSALLATEVTGTASFEWAVSRDGAVIAGGSGEIFSFTPDDDGLYEVSLTVLDDNGQVGGAGASVTVANVDPEPALDGPGTGTAGEAYTLYLSVTDPGADTLSAWTIDWGDGTVGTLSGDAETSTHAFTAGHYEITAFATDEDGIFQAENSLGLTVFDADAPILISGLPALGEEGTPISLSAVAHDPPATVASWAWTVSSASEGDYASGDQQTFAFTPDDDGIYTVSVTAYDATGGVIGEASATVTVTNAAPGLVLDGASVVMGGAPYTLSLSAGDPGDDRIEAWFIDWGDGTREMVTPDATPAVHTYAEGLAEYTITATAADEDGVWAAIDSLCLRVTGAVAIDGVPETALEEGTTVALSALVNTSTAGTPVYAWTVTRDGESCAAGNGEAFDFVGDDNGAYAVTLVVSDDTGEIGAASGEFTVANAAPFIHADSAAVTVDEGETASISGAFGDAGNDTLSLNASVGEIVDNGDGTWSWRMDTTGADLSQAVTLTVTDDDGAVASTTFALTVVNLAPSLAANRPTVTVEAGNPAINSGVFSDPGDDSVSLTASVGTLTVADGHWIWSGDTTAGPGYSHTITITATDSDGAATEIDFELVAVNDAPVLGVNAMQVTVEEGRVAANGGTYVDAADLTASAGTVVDNGNGTWTWQMTATDGPDQDRTVTITATDDYGATSSIDFDLIVNNVAPSVAADQTVVTVDEGAIATNSGTFFDPGEDTVALTASVGTVTDNGDGTWIWSLGTTDGPDDSRTVTITATDSDGGSRSVSFDLIVNNLAPTVAIVGLPETSTVGTAVSLSSGVTDPGADMFTYAWRVTRDGEEYAAGDGADFEFTPDDEGEYVVSLTVSDDDGACGADTSSVNVISWAQSVLMDFDGDGDVDGIDALYVVRQYRLGEMAGSDSVVFPSQLDRDAARVTAAAMDDEYPADDEWSQVLREDQVSPLGRVPGQWENVAPASWWGEARVDAAPFPWDYGLNGCLENLFGDHEDDDLLGNVWADRSPA